MDKMEQMQTANSFNQSWFIGPAILGNKFKLCTRCFLVWKQTRGNRNRLCSHRLHLQFIYRITACIGVYKLDVDLRLLLNSCPTLIIFLFINITCDLVRTYYHFILQIRPTVPLSIWNKYAYCNSCQYVVFDRWGGISFCGPTYSAAGTRLFQRRTLFSVTLWTVRALCQRVNRVK